MSDNNLDEQDQAKPNNKKIAASIALGVGVGFLIGAITQEVGVGIGVGIVMVLVLSVSKRKTD